MSKRSNEHPPKVCPGWTIKSYSGDLIVMSPVGTPFIACKSRAVAERIAAALNLADAAEPEEQQWIDSQQPGERTEKPKAASGGDLFREMLSRFAATEVERPGIRETPSRMAKAWDDLTSGYRTDVESLFKTFEDGAERFDELVIVRDIPVWSLCEHHCLPFFGVAHIGYVPEGRILGLSKFARIVDAFARRLQVQERLTTQIGTAIVEHLKPLATGVILQCRHTCMEMRGVKAQGTSTTTSFTHGALRESGALRAEFMGLIR